MGKEKVSDEILVEKYEELNNVWKVGDAVGLCGQTVHQRLTKLGVINKMRVLTDCEKGLIRDLYSAGFVCGDKKLKELSKMINRTIPFISRYAKSINLTNRKRCSSDELKMDVGERTKKWLSENEHPRGYLGKMHSVETKKAISEAVSQRMGAMTPDEFEKRRIVSNKTRIKNKTRGHDNSYSRGKAGKRKDIDDIYFRSAAEANYARWLKFSGIKFMYEKKTFYFDPIKRGTISYTPDFYIPSEDRYIEFKGWLDPKSITRIKRFKKYYPEEFSKMQIVKQRLNEKGICELIKIGFKHHQIINFKDIEQWSNIITGWEYPTPRKKTKRVAH